MNEVRNFLKQPETACISLKKNKKNKNLYNFSVDNFVMDRYMGSYSSYDEYEVVNTSYDTIMGHSYGLEDYKKYIFDQLTDKPNSDSTKEFDVLFYNTRESLKNNRDSNEKLESSIKFGDLIYSLDTLLNNDMYVIKEVTTDATTVPTRTYILENNKDILKYDISFVSNAYYWNKSSLHNYNSIVLKMYVNEVNMCNVQLKAGEEIDIEYIMPNFKFKDLVSFVNKSLDILHVRKLKIETKKAEFKKDIREFYSDNSMEILVNRIQEFAGESDV